MHTKKAEEGTLSCVTNFIIIVLQNADICYFIFIKGYKGKRTI